MNLHGAAGNFGVGLTNSTYWASHSHLVEFKAAADTATGVWGGVSPITVTEATVSSQLMRSNADISMKFTLPETSGTVTASSDYVALTLPHQWGGVHGWADGTVQASASLKLLTTKGTTTTSTAVKGKVVQLSGCTVVFQIDTDQTKLAEKSSYQFTVSGVPGPENAAEAKAMNLGSLVLSVGKVATGGFGYTQAAMFPALKTMGPAAGIAVLEFSNQLVSVSRGTYAKNVVCIQPASGNFAAAVSASVKGTAFKTNPASISASMGQGPACADLGTAATTQTSVHNVRWTVNNGTAAYTQLPTLMVSVNSVKAKVKVAETITCSEGGSSVPILVSASAVPFADIKVSLTGSTTKDGDKTTDNSVGITPNTGEVVTLKVGTNSGVLGFKCAAKVTGKELLYKLEGTDKAVFELDFQKVTVAATKPGNKPATVDMKLAMVSAKSKAASTVVSGQCPGMGSAWFSIQPENFGAMTPLASVTDVRTANGKFDNSVANLHTQPQWCYDTVTKAD